LLISSSFAGYGKVGCVFIHKYTLVSANCWNWCDSFDRRFRVYDISDYGETIRTYKRLANDEIVDEMALAGHGAPEPYIW
jgi:hypothetical protein